MYLIIVHIQMEFFSFYYFLLFYIYEFCEFLFHLCLKWLNYSTITVWYQKLSWYKFSVDAFATEELCSKPVVQLESFWFERTFFESVRPCRIWRFCCILHENRYRIQVWLPILSQILWTTFFPECESVKFEKYSRKIVSNIGFWSDFAKFQGQG